MTWLHDYMDLASFFAASLATAGAVGIGGSQVGTFVLYRREGMLVLALPQIIAIGVAIALRFNWPVIWPALAIASLAVFVLGWSKRRGLSHWVLPSLYIAGLSLSFLLIANAAAHVEQMQHRLTGMDVAVTAATAWVAVPVALIVGVATSLLWRRWLVLAQAPAAAELAGLHPRRWDVAFLCLLATMLMFGTAALGAVMVLTMLFLPAASVAPWTRRVPTALSAAGLVSLMYLAAGFVMSNEMSWPFSHSVGGVGCAGLIGSHVMRSLTRP